LKTDNPPTELRYHPIVRCFSSNDAVIVENGSLRVGAMENDEHLSSLIGDIYDAALEPALWSAVLGKTRGFVGGSAAALYFKDAIRKSGKLHYEDGGLDRHYLQLYMKKYAKLDPFTTGHFFAEIGQPTATTDLMPYDEFLATRFYREWVRPQRLVDNATAALDKSSTGVALYSIFRHERDGVVDNETRHRMRLIVPHMRRAVLIGRVIDLKTAEAETFANILDGISAGMFLVDARGRIIHANASGHVLLGEGSLLRAVGGKLTANDANAEAALHEIFIAAGSGDAAVGTKGIAVPLITRNGERYVAHMLPLTSGARRRAGTSYAAVAALFVHKAALETPSPPEVIAKTYRLTPSELRVLLGVVEVGGVAETAETLGIGEGTVKTHLHRLFTKTGTSRQAELVKLVAGFSNPLVG
jgi:DNA-binding CsgD family transcriptional regulator/PAS domain-containing protein